MIETYLYNEEDPKFTLKRYFQHTYHADNRHDNIHRYLKKYKDTKQKVCLIVNDSHILPCMELILREKLTSKYEHIIVYMPEGYWDTFNDSKTLQNKIDKIDDSEKITIIFNFFCDSPFDLKNINYITTIGCFGSITKLYLNRYKFKSLKENYNNIKYNVISKFGRPSEEKLFVYEKVKDFDNFVYSINSAGKATYSDVGDNVAAKNFPSEINAKNNFRASTLPMEDFQSASEIVVETRFSTFKDGKRLVTNTEKTLKGFMFKRPSFLFAQPESYPYLKQYGFKFPKFFGYDSGNATLYRGELKTELFNMIEKVCNMNTSDLLDMFIEEEDVWEHNYDNLHSFIELHESRIENIFKKVV
jgi:hypothetical protein